MVPAKPPRLLPFLLPVILLPPLVAGCVGEGASSAGYGGSGSFQPRVSFFRCEDKGTITVEQRGGSVRLTDLDGENVELPAAPPGQRSRYGQAPYALVLDGDQALYMKSGRTPAATCTRGARPPVSND